MINYLLGCTPKRGAIEEVSMENDPNHTTCIRYRPDLGITQVSPVRMHSIYSGMSASHWDVLSMYLHSTPKTGGIYVRQIYQATLFVHYFDEFFAGVEEFTSVRA